jgi:pimeloyl-ACP methyl ester carboxylesterase
MVMLGVFLIGAAWGATLAWWTLRRHPEQTKQPNKER